MNKQYNIEGINLNLFDNIEILNIIKKSLLNNTSINIFYANVYVFSNLVKNEKAKLIFNKGLIINDGVGINLFLKIITGYNNIQRTVTTDIWNSVLKFCSDYNKKIIIYGGSRNREHEINKFLNQYPGIELVAYSDGYSNFDVSKYKADIIFVGIGSFKQVYYIDSLSNNFDISAKIAVGSAIDFWSGAKTRAPLWMQKIGLEWLYRLFQEPKRLWKRYILGIPFFVFLVIVKKMKKHSKLH